MRTTIDPIIDVPDNYQTHRTNYGLDTVAFADHSTRALLAAKTVNIPGKSGQTYTLHGVEIVVFSATNVTTQNTGGLFEFENDAVDWKPFEVYPNVQTVLGTGGFPHSITKISCHKPLPAGSNVTVYYTARAAGTDMPIVSLVWSTEPYNGDQTYIKSALGTSLTQITMATANATVAIPANKGGKLCGFYTQTYGVAETLVTSGGYVNVRNVSSNPTIDPCQFTWGGFSGITTAAGELLINRVPFIGDSPGNSSFIFDVQPQDNQATVLAVMVVWEG